MLSSFSEGGGWAVAMNSTTLAGTNTPQNQIKNSWIPPQR